jgi:uncharacterized protein (UPF0332 family)
MENAKETLHKSPIEDNTYLDIKYVKSACGTAYLGVLRAIDEYLLKKGVTPKELPKKIEEYEKALQKYLSVYNGKLTTQLKVIYNELHIAGYYRGLLQHTDMVKAVLKNAQNFIDKIQK